MATASNQSDWKKTLLLTSLPRWDDLPDIDIYMDQLVTLVERYTATLRVETGDTKIITPSMVNNYVKLKLIPAPQKKKYCRTQLARLIVITILKQVFDIPSIKAGIEFQVSLSDSKTAYNYFCEHIEQTIHFFIGSRDEEIQLEDLRSDFTPIQMACTTLVAKLITEKELQALLQQKTDDGEISS